MINEQAIKEYVENKGEKCPFCKSAKNIRNPPVYLSCGNNGQIDYTRERGCGSCNAEWTDIYQLVSIRV